MNSNSEGRIYRVLELFSGIGGMVWNNHDDDGNAQRVACGLAHEHYSSQGCDVSFVPARAYDINEHANAVYKHNFGMHEIPRLYMTGDDACTKTLTSVDSLEFDNLHADIVMMSPPCQPFTRQGVQRDDDDNRSEALIHVMSACTMCLTNVMM